LVRGFGLIAFKVGNNQLNTKNVAKVNIGLIINAAIVKV